MHNHRISKRKRQAILFFTYGFMTLATLVISAICLLLILGYRFDIVDRTLEQGGLLQFRSTPSGADIVVDGKQQSVRTPGKLDVAAGKHAVAMKRTGYRDWSRTVSIKAGELRWLNYARLVPTKIVTTDAVKFDSGVDDALPTPDRRFVAVLSNAKHPIISVYDLRNPDSINAVNFTIPIEQLTLLPDQESRFDIAEWDYGSRFLLITHNVGELVEYIRLDRASETGTPRNLTKEFNLQFRDLHFSGTSGAILYGLTGTDIRRVDVGGGSVSQPLVIGVESYRLYRENDIAFVAKRADKRVAGVYINNKETLVRSVNTDQPLLVDISQYYSHYYLAISSPKSLIVVKDPVESTEASRKDHVEVPLTSHGATWIDFGSSGRFVITGTTDAYSVYDLETDETYTVQAPLTIDPATAPRWLDDFYIVSTTSSQVKLFEYDGNYAQTIVGALPHLPAFLSDDGTFLYSFAQKDSKTVMQASRLILKN